MLLTPHKSLIDRYILSEKKESRKLLDKEISRWVRTAMWEKKWSRNIKNHKVSKANREEEETLRKLPIPLRSVEYYIQLNEMIRRSQTGACNIAKKITAVVDFKPQKTIFDWHENKNQHLFAPKEEKESEVAEALEIIDNDVE